MSISNADVLVAIGSADGKSGFMGAYNADGKGLVHIGAGEKSGSMSIMMGIVQMERRSAANDGLISIIIGGGGDFRAD